MMPRKEGEISPRRAASILKKHRNTVYRWCDEATASEPAGPLVGHARKDERGRIWIEKGYVNDLADAF